MTDNSLLEFLTKNISIKGNPEKMRKDGENKEICKKCGEKWCYKKWQIQIPKTKENGVKKVILTETTSNPVVQALKTDPKNIDKSLKELYKKNDETLPKFINGYTEKIYCYMRYIKEQKSSKLIRYGYKFSVKDDKILYIFFTPNIRYIGAIGEKYIYRFNGDIPYRLPIWFPFKPKTKIGEDLMELFETFGENIPLKKLKKK